MATGRQLIERAAREPMAVRGWRPRAAGWFTRPITGRLTAVVVVGTASEHAPPGTALVHPHVGLRDEVVEPLVAQLSEVPDAGYRRTTLSTYLAYLAPDPTFREWVVTEDTAARVAVLMASAVDELGLPFLEQTSRSPEDFLRSFERFFVLAGVPGVCRRAVVLELGGRREEALAFLDQQAADIAGQSNPYAAGLAPALARTRTWVTARIPAGWRLRADDSGLTTPG